MCYFIYDGGDDGSHGAYDSVGDRDGGMRKDVVEVEGVVVVVGGGGGDGGGSNGRGWW